MMPSRRTAANHSGVMRSYRTALTSSQYPNCLSINADRAPPPVTCLPAPVAEMRSRPASPNACALWSRTKGGRVDSSVHNSPYVKGLRIRRIFQRARRQALGSPVATAHSHDAVTSRRAA